jgi:hypothetical protein
MRDAVPNHWRAAIRRPALLDGRRGRVGTVTVLSQPIDLMAASMMEATGSGFDT